MRSFNRRTFHLALQKWLSRTLGLALAWTLAACNLPSPSQATSPGGASFVVSSQDASFTQVSAQNSFALPTAKTMAAKFCITDIQYNRIVANHKFTVSGGANNQDVTTDGTGCAVWQEDISFNDLSTPAFVELDRTLTAVGYQKGSRVISFALNPWEDQILSLKDSRVSNLISGDQALARLKGSDATQASRPLWLENTSVTFTPKSYKANYIDYNIEVQADPKIVLKDMNAQDTRVALTQGQFNVRLSLIRSDDTAGKASRVLVAQTGVLSVTSLTSSQLIVSADMKAPGASNMSQFYLGVEVNPVNGPQGLQAFHGVYQLGSYSSLATKQQPPLLTEGDLAGNGGPQFSISQFLTTAPNATTMSTTSDGSSYNTSIDSSSGVQGAGVDVGTITATGQSVSIQDSYVNQTRFFLNFCLVAGDGSYLSNQPVKVTGISGQTVSKNTDIHGCVSAEDMISSNFYAPECWTKQSILVQSDALGLNKKIDVQYNVDSQMGVFLRDMRGVAEITNNDSSQCALGQTALQTTAFYMDKDQFSYSVDELLNLQINKTSNVRITMTLNRPSFIQEGASNLNLPVGQYTFRWAIVDTTVTDYTKAAGHIYSAGEQEITMKSNSTILEPITFSITNIKSLGNTNYLLFEVIPKGDEPKNMLSGMRTVTFRAPMNLYNNSDGAGATDTGLDSIVPLLIQQLKIDKAAALAAAKTLSTKDKFASDNNLKMLSLAAGDQFGSDRNYVSNGQMQAWLSSGSIDPQTLHGICEFWIVEVLTQPLASGKQSPFTLRNRSSIALRESLIDDCVNQAQTDPRHYFDLQYRYFIQHGSKVADLGAVPRDLNINNAFSLSNSYSIGVSQGVGLKIDAGLGLGVGTSSEAPGMPSLGLSGSVGGGVAYHLDESWGTSQSWGDSINVSAGISATVETIGLRVQAQDYEKCAVIKLNTSQMIRQTSSSYQTSGIGSWVHKIFGQKPMESVTSNLTDDEKAELASRGYMVCMGKLAGKPMVFDENYYNIYQKTPATIGMDGSSDMNRPFFVAIRGRGDLVSFLSFIEQSSGVPAGYTQDYQQSYLLDDPTLNVFKRGFVTYPGQIIEAQ